MYVIARIAIVCNCYFKIIVKKNPQQFINRYFKNSKFLRRKQSSLNPRNQRQDATQKTTSCCCS